MVCMAMVAPAAQAAGVVVWLGDSPSTAALQKAERKTTASDWVAPDAAWAAPDPISSADTAAQDQLKEAINSARSRWDEFEVEASIAADLQRAIDGVSVVASEAERDLLVTALVWQGAAVAKAFSSSSLLESPDAAPYRTADGLNRPWRDALALKPDLGRDQMVDGTAWDHFQSFANQAPADGAMDLSKLGELGDIVLDGRPVDPTTLTVGAGRHYVHLVQDGVVHGRMQVIVEPSKSSALPDAGIVAAWGAAANTLAGGTSVGFPDPVRDALHRWGQGSQAVFVATEKDGRVIVQAYAQGAQLAASRRITGVFAGDIGGGGAVSAMFDGAEQSVVAGAISGGISAELGVSYFAAATGVDLTITPGETVAFANSNETSNLHTAATFHIWGGVGAYPLRPVGRNTTLGILATVGWNSPAHILYGGRVLLGIPVGDAEWFRVSAGAATGPNSLWDTGDERIPLTQFFVRIGFGKGV